MVQSQRWARRRRRNAARGLVLRRSDPRIAELLEIADARVDQRFASSPLVTAGLRVRFYAAAPLLTPAGDALGTISVLDREARTLTGVQRDQLALLAHLVMYELEPDKLLPQLADGSRERHRPHPNGVELARPSTAVRALLDAVGSRNRRHSRACCGAPSTVRTASSRRSTTARYPAGARPPGAAAFALEHTPADELALSIPHASSYPEFLLAVRYPDRRPEESDRSALRARRLGVRDRRP